MSEELVAFFKVLSDANRLKIIGLLAHQPYSVEELAALLGLKASTVSHHLSNFRRLVWLVQKQRVTIMSINSTKKHWRKNHVACSRRRK